MKNYILILQSLLILISSWVSITFSQETAPGLSLPQIVIYNPDSVLIKPKKIIGFNENFKYHQKIPSLKFKKGIFLPQKRKISLFPNVHNKSRGDELLTQLNLRLGYNQWLYLNLKNILAKNNYFNKFNFNYESFQSHPDFDHKYQHFLIQDNFKIFTAQKINLEINSLFSRNHNPLNLFSPEKSTVQLIDHKNQFLFNPKIEFSKLNLFSDLTYENITKQQFLTKNNEDLMEYSSNRISSLTQLLFNFQGKKYRLISDNHLNFVSSDLSGEQYSNTYLLIKTGIKSDFYQFNYTLLPLYIKTPFSNQIDFEFLIEKKLIWKKKAEFFLSAGRKFSGNHTTVFDNRIDLFFRNREFHHINEPNRTNFIRLAALYNFQSKLTSSLNLSFQNSSQYLYWTLIDFGDDQYQRIPVFKNNLNYFLLESTVSFNQDEKFRIESNFRFNTLQLFNSAVYNSPFFTAEVLLVNQLPYSLSSQVHVNFVSSFQANANQKQKEFFTINYEIRKVLNQKFELYMIIENILNREQYYYYPYIGDKLRIGAGLIYNF